MIKKRVIASILVNNGYAVQSFGYEKYLPLGDPKILVEKIINKPISKQDKYNHSELI